MTKFRTRVCSRGFTLVEIVVAVALLGIIVAMSASVMREIEASAALKSSTDEIYRAFTDARNRTLASENDTVYGVLVSTSSVTRFVGGTYIANDSTNQVFQFHRGVVASGALVTPPTPITFRRLTGEPSVTGDILIEETLTYASNTFTIYPSGLVEY